MEIIFPPIFGRKKSDNTGRKSCGFALGFPQTKLPREMVLFFGPRPSHPNWKNMRKSKLQSTTLQGLPSRKLTYSIPYQSTFEDEFPFPQVGYVSSPEG